MKNHIPATPLIGRTEDIAAIARAVRQGTRLVTLVGPPGIGKTRLAVAVAETLAAERADGVCFVALDAVRDADLIAPTIGQALGVAEVAGQPFTETLVHYLHDTRALLLLDHVAPATATPIVTALLTTPGLTLLVTGQTPLGVAGEHVYTVPPLSLPEATTDVPPADLIASDAARLFIERARAADPTFLAAPGADAPAIAAICRRVGGLPLAIELVAARAATLPLSAILDVLRSRLPAPPPEAPDGAMYERILRATIDWSGGLLPEPVQRLLERLALFVGGCTLEAASAVCDATVTGVDVADGLRTLCGLALVQRIEDEGGESRFRLLETIRGYAAAQLAAHGGEAETWRRYVTYYTTLADQTELMLRGPQQVQWLNRLEAELGNLRAVLRWAFAHDHAALGLRLAGALDRFWQYHTHVTEGRQWLMRGLARDGAAPIVRAKALALAGWLARFQDEMPKAQALLTESLALYRGLDDRRGIAEVTDTLGDLAHFRGDQETARALHERNLALRRELGDRWGMAMSLNSLGWIALAQNDHRRAVMSLQESLAIVRQLRDARGMAMVLTGLGWASLDRDDARQAHICMRESLILFRGLGSKIDICLCLDGLAAVAGMRGEAERAARFFGAADVLHTAMNVDYAPITERHYARHRDAAREKIGATAWSVAWEAGRALPLDQAIAEALSAGAGDDGTAPRME